MEQLNLLLSGLVKVSYNVATNTYTYKNIGIGTISIIPQNCNKLLGLTILCQLPHWERHQDI